MTIKGIVKKNMLQETLLQANITSKLELYNYM